MKGTVKTIVQDRGFGFITPEDGSKDLFFHFQGMKEKDGMTSDALFAAVKVGDMVSFEVGDSDKGPKAVDVEKLEAEFGLTASVRLSTRAALLVTLPAIEPVVPPLPTCRVPAPMVVPPL